MIRVLPKKNVLLAEHAHLSAYLRDMGGVTPCAPRDCEDKIIHNRLLKIEEALKMIEFNKLNGSIDMMFFGEGADRLGIQTRRDIFVALTKLTRFSTHEYIQEQVEQLASVLDAMQDNLDNLQRLYDNWVRVVAEHEAEETKFCKIM